MIVRAGSTLAGIAAAGAAILVPLPTTFDDRQRKGAVRRAAEVLDHAS